MTQDDLRDFLENAPDAMHALGPDGRILWANAAELGLLGYSADEYIGEHAASFHADRRIIDEILARLRRRETIRNCPARVRHKDGSTRDVLITSSASWRDGEFIHACSIMRDITEQRRLETEREHAARHLAAEHAVTKILASGRPFGEVSGELLAIIGLIGDWRLGAMWMVDERADLLRFYDSWRAPDVHDARFRADANSRTFAAGVGLPGRVWASARTTWIDDVVANENFPRSELAQQAGFHTAIAFPIRVRGRVVGVAEFFSADVRDVDNDLLQLFDALGTQIGLFIERREHAEALEASESRFRLLADAAPVMIWVAERDHGFEFGNRAFVDFFGVPLEELHEARASSYLHPDDIEEALARYREAVDRLLPFRCVSRCRRADGEYRWIESYAEPHLSPAGELMAYVGVSLDVTERRAAEDVLMESEAEARASLKIRDDFLSVAAHELRNPLNALQLQLVTLHRAAQLGSEWLSRDWVAERVGQATEDVDTLVRLVHNLLDVARLASGRLDVEPEDLDFAEVIRGVVRRFGEQLAGNQVVVEVPAVAGRSDRLRLEQIVTNLVSNAVKFGAGKPIEIVLRADDERAYFSVTDHGIGIESARQPELFERFSRAVPRREYGGFGLGLWIARETVRALGGEIWLTSAPGEGSTFSVSLPRVFSPTAVSYAAT